MEEMRSIRSVGYAIHHFGHPLNKFSILCGHRGEDARTAGSGIYLEES